MLDRDIKLLAERSDESPSWRPSPLKSKSGRPATHGSMTGSLSQAALVGLPSLSPPASASVILSLTQPSSPATPSGPWQVHVPGVTSSSFSTSRRFDSMVQRYAMLGPHAVY